MAPVVDVIRSTISALRSVSWRLISMPASPIRSNTSVLVELSFSEI